MVFLYSEDPEWSNETFSRAAKEIGIKPIQAYKWGYHKKIKVAELEKQKEAEKVNLV